MQPLERPRDRQTERRGRDPPAAGVRVHAVTVIEQPARGLGRRAAFDGAMRRFAANPLDDGAFWQPAPLLSRLAAEGKTFN